MGRGFISGIVWGAIVGVFIIVIASQMGVRQELALPQPSATPVEVPVGTEFNQARPESNPVVPRTDATPSGDEVASGSLSPVGDVDTLPTAETQSGLAPLPNVASPESGDAPQVPEAADIDVAEVEDAPAQSQGVAPGGQQAAVALPDVDQTEAPSAPAPAPAPAAPSIADNATDSGTSGVEASEAEAAPERIAPGGLASLDPGQTPETPEALPQAETPTLQGETPAVAEPIGVPVPPAEELSPQVRTNRLPQIGGAPAETPEPEVVVPEATEVAVAEEGALRAHRRDFDATGGNPILSVVLVHGADSDLDTLVGLPFPISIAVDVANPDAGEVAKRIRSEGGEVVMIPALPDGAAPADIEVALQSNIAVIPEAVALMDLPEASFQTNRAAVTQIVAAVAESGHALVTFPRGLNTAQKLAERDGVPTGLIFRDLQGAGQGDVHRTLDQAAFRARQQASVILVGRATPETVAALTEWALGNRAETVTIAPVSAAILVDENAS